jgi:hypothetical protein
MPPMVMPLIIDGIDEASIESPLEGYKKYRCE